ncbi:peptide/nickel transport system ATP-binding protein [Sporobacter termitidis DSM 10068]|uniref:Peptide/nickel transport system ATP-binding protein n=1 Tax=Sporobacter termitidis DSM 10068 TaxID=1123282 RepID=A0A1M5XAU5_9FIRM|nr:ABC transporter ATP-binding protein [Sporobacter termitidis]SHH96906.1 peptide/nickel transport system ATP-binding protein [Sporobacter termitidis DSM 10068]
MEQLLDIQGLSVEVLNGGRYYKAVEQVGFQIGKGETVGLVGESGCGKSLTALSIMGLLPETARAGGRVLFRGRDLLSLTEEEKCVFRGRDISIVFQEPMTALNPLVPVGRQIAEAFLLHHTGSRAEAREAAIGMMRQVGLSRAPSLYWEYPHQLSGGMKQRVVICMALINRPALLIADEPTTALDVTIQFQILELIRQLNRTLSATVLFISHDLGVVKEVCSRLLVMYAGLIVEEGGTEDVLRHPMHPYTRQLLASIPTAQNRGRDLYSIPGAVAPLDKRKPDVCPFSDRCAQASAVCFSAAPALRGLNGRRVRCFLAGGEAIERC